MIQLEYKKLKEEAKKPEKAHIEDAAWDIFACGKTSLMSGETKIVSSGIAIRPPEGYHCDLRGRSGMNSKAKFVILGLIDAGYSGEWGVVIFNGTKDVIEINHHDKIAQFVVHKTLQSELVEVKEFEEVLGKRNSGGFGSTDSKKNI